MPVGRVLSVHVYPVKSAAAPPAGAIMLEADGAVGDRWFQVTDLEGTAVTAAEAPELRGVVALLAMDGAPVLDIPGAPPALRGQRADTELSGLLGRGVRIVPAVRDAGRLEAPVHVVSVQSVEAARRGEHQAADCACSLEEPRANLILELRGAYAGPADGGSPSHEALLLEGPSGSATR